jgi:hypothetical protein
MNKMSKSSNLALFGALEMFIVHPLLARSDTGVEPARRAKPSATGRWWQVVVYDVFGGKRFKYPRTKCKKAGAFVPALNAWFLCP